LEERRKAVETLAAGVSACFMTETHMIMSERVA
jgi:organic hydroperoxide reductase OsmC/OhrA